MSAHLKYAFLRLMRQNPLYADVNGDGSMKATGQAVLSQNSDEPIKLLK